MKVNSKYKFFKYGTDFQDFRSKTSLGTEALILLQESLVQIIIVDVLHYVTMKTEKSHAGILAGNPE